MLVNKDNQQSSPVVVEVPPPKQEAMDVEQAFEEESSGGRATYDQPSISSPLRTTDNQCLNQLSTNSASQTDTSSPSVSAVKVSEVCLKLISFSGQVHFQQLSTSNCFWCCLFQSLIGEASYMYFVYWSLNLCRFFMYFYCYYYNQGVCELLGWIQCSEFCKIYQPGSCCYCDSHGNKVIAKKTIALKSTACRLAGRLYFRKHIKKKSTALGHMYWPEILRFTDLLKVPEPWF